MVSASTRVINHLGNNLFYSLVHDSLYVHTDIEGAGFIRVSDRQGVGAWLHSA